MLTHIVLFKLKDRAPENIAKVRGVLAGMEGKIPEFRHFEVGVDVVRSHRSYDLALVAKFDSLKGFRAYQAHPAHQEVVRSILSASDSIFAVDYES
ncbi:MAG: Dabb family protein [Deltaproteobacteria bacterium]|nr:Dabb family protein [Deltaproteobacteria bacterium]